MRKYIPSHIKKFVREKRYNASHTIAELYARLLSRKHGSKADRVLLMSPTPYWGSLGDEAMLIASCEYLQRNGCQVGVCVNSREDLPNFTNGFDAVVSIPNLYTPKLRTGVDFINKVKEWDAIGVFGADVIDGVYSKERSVAMLDKIIEMKELGAHAALLGSSVRGHDVKPQTREKLKTIGEERLHFRDPVSANRVHRVTGLNGVVVADAAFLLESRLCSSGERLLEKIDEFSKSTNHTWGVNTNWRLFDGYIDRQDYISLVVEIAGKVDKRFGRTSFVLLPHDTRGGRGSDFEVASDIDRRMKEEGMYSICPDPEIRSYSIKRVCQDFDFVLTSRMHVAIAALGVGCPVASISYQGKFEGLYEHFGLNQGIFPGKRIAERQALQRFVLSTFENREKMKAQIRSELPRIKDLAERNFDYLF